MSEVIGAVEDVAKVAGGSAGGSFIPWALLAVVVAIGAAGAFGFYKGDAMRAAQDSAKYAAAQKKADDAWQAKVDAQRARGDKIAADLETEKANVKTVTLTVVKEVPKVTTVYKEKAGAPSIALNNIFTWGFVRLYDDALDPSVKHDVSAAAGVPAGSAAEADLVRSGVSTADVLTNHAENAGQYADCRNSLNALIDWHEQNPTEKK
ncbi:hypothetical protein [Paraburkholderia phenoliruptrix]|uniref:hypothetical protein n=1 Tax=Paraburkholderia phenoliruptrix TaxID=252970 RepID=UPI0034D00DD7